MERADAVYLVASDDSEVCHADEFAARFFENRDIFYLLEVEVAEVTCFVDESAVNFVDYLKLSRKERSHDFDIPLFDSFGQNGVVGVGESVARDFPGLVPAEFFLVDKYSHKFGYRDARVRVVELDRNF